MTTEIDAVARSAPQTPAPRPLRQIVFWCLYDWANSAYPAVILSFVFAPYFLKHVATDAVSGQAAWGFAVAGSAVAVALLSPILGAFADRGGRPRTWLGVTSVVAILATAALWRATPSPDSAFVALALMATATAAFELGYVFYNALLPVVAPENRIGRVSGFGWGAGYLGSLAALGAVLALFVTPDPPLFGLSREGMEPIRASAVFTALWFTLFAAPLVLFGPPGGGGRGESAATQVREGLADLWETLRALGRMRSIAWFLVAHMLFIDGVNTLFVLGPLFAAGAFAFTQSELLLFGVTIYLAAGAGSFALGWLDDRIGPKPVLLSAILVCLGLSVVLVLVTDRTVFWALCGVIGMCFGPIQSSSRSLMVRLSPPDQRAKLFGLYALAGRATAPLGPAAAAWITLATDSQRGGIVVVALLLLGGALLLLPVRNPGRAQA